MPTRTDSFYIETTLPPGLTIAEYRRSRPPRQKFALRRTLSSARCRSGWGLSLRSS